MNARGVMVLALAFLFLAPCGCRHGHDQAAVQEPPAAGAAAGDGAASPPSSYKEQRLAEAMRGLDYASGRVVVDPAFAAQQPDRGDPRAAEAEYLLGRKQLFEVNDRVAAIAAFTRAVILSPGVPRYHAGLGEALQRKGKAAEALAALRTALDLDPGLLEARLLLARGLQMGGDLAGSSLAWQQVLELDPRSGEAYGRLAILDYYQGAYETAWGHVRQAEALGYDLPAQFRPLLAARLAEPVR